MNLIYKGADITNSVTIKKCIYESYAEKHADTMRIVLDDELHMMDAWGFAIDNEIQATSDNLDTGVLYVNEISVDGTSLTLECSTIKSGMNQKNSRTWSNVPLSQIVADIATSNGLSYRCYGVDNNVYSYLTQNNQCDFDFLEDLCLLEGLGFLIYRCSLVVYSFDYMSDQGKNNTIDIANGATYKFSRGTHYGSAFITNGSYEYIYTESEGDLVKKEVGTVIYDYSQAERVAKNLLYDANKQYEIGTVEVAQLVSDIAPGTVGTISPAYATSFSGLAFIYRVRYDLYGSKTKVWIRRL